MPLSFGERFTCIRWNRTDFTTKDKMTASGGEMRSEFKRYATFSGFHAPQGVWPSQLAREGFWRSGTCGDHEVVCFSCGIKLDVRTVAKKSLIDIHKRLSPNCGFVAGSSGNQPVPDVAFDREAFDDLLQEMEISSHSYTYSYSHPHLRDSAPVGIDNFSAPAPFFPGGNSIPIMQIPLLSNMGATDQADLTTLPMDLVDGLANANLSSLATASLFGEVENSGLSQSADLFNSVGLLGGSDGDLEYDAEDDGVEGKFPEDVSTSELRGSLSGIVSLPVSTQAAGGEISSIEPPKKLDFADLGIITHRPKKQDMCGLQGRLQSLRNKVSVQMVQTDQSLAEAGFYYAGYSDCCRCFYCGGGLKSWKEDDDPWIEHARFFRDCPFVLMNKGKDFVDAVQSLAGNPSISAEDVKARMVQRTSCQSLQNDDVVDETFPDEMETVDYDEAEQNLQTENKSLREPELCKVCLDQMVNVLFLPCGHLMSCSLCAPSLKNCPVCRQVIIGHVPIQRSD